MRLLVAFIVFLLGVGVYGCASSSAIMGPDGTEHQLITCGGIEGCYEKATETCHGKYKIVNSSSESGGYNGVVTTNTKLLVKCEGK